MSLNKRAMWAHGAIVAKSSHLRHVFSGYENQTNIARKCSRVVGCHLRHVFSGYENQANIARKWSRVVGEVYEKNPNYGHIRAHDNMVPWPLRALGTTRQRLRRWIYSLIYYLSFEQQFSTYSERLTNPCRRFFLRWYRDAILLSQWVWSTQKYI